MRAIEIPTYIAVAVAVISAAACGDAMPIATERAELPSIQSVSDSQWTALASKRVFFGHQSVGGNIMDGVAEILSANPKIALRVVESRSADSASNAGFFHAAVGRNDYPLEKFKDFATVASSGFGKDGGIAMMKLCYVDIHTHTDAQALFDEYRKAVSEVKSRNPSVTVVHVTTPLTVNENWKGRLMSTLRGYSTQRQRNVVRHKYNELLRQAYSGKEPIFDLAHLESRFPDGRLSRYNAAGQPIPLLVAEYSDDGAHLNASARRMVAEQLLITLARLPEGQRAESARGSR
jgi:hypothetical protein